MLVYSFTCPLPNGIHARPASALEEVARPFAAAVLLNNDRTGQAANAKSVLGIAGLDIRFEDPCSITVDGADEAAAFATLTRFLEHEFPHCDDALPVIEQQASEVALPPMLRGANAVVHRATAVVGGIGIGRARHIGEFIVPPTIPTRRPGDAEGETARLEAALRQLDLHYGDRLARAKAPVESAIVRAHKSIARDPEFRHALVAAIREQDATIAGALAEAQARFTRMLLGSGSALLRERALDIRDVCRELLREVYGKPAAEGEVVLASDSVCLAESLTPGQFLTLDRTFLKGLALAHAGTTSHTVILARSFGVPTVVGVTGLDLLTLADQDVVVDGELGVLVSGLTETARRYYEMERLRLDGRRQRLRRFETSTAKTSDGRRIEVAANVGIADEAARAFAVGAEAVGLFRTEVLFLDRPDPPSEEEQFNEYRRALVAAEGRPVIIRTLDAGGDKAIPYLALPPEDNPFLGYRAVRLYPEFDTIIRSQVRALARASAFGRLKVMVPMVSRVEEVRWFRAIVAEEQERLSNAGTPVDPDMQVGIMIEIPAAVFALDQLSPACDFFSIGTNDLLQYFTAVDRSNARIASLSSTLAPSFLRLLKMVVEGAHAHGRWVGLCGEMGGDRRALPLLVGLGLDEISMAAPAVLRAKADLSALAASDCAALLQQALQCADSTEVEALVARFEQGRGAPLIAAELMIVDGSAQTKEEAIKQAVDCLYVAGRTDRPREVEDAVWQREATYSTGFGFGCAIPHCKTNAVSANSLVLLKLRAPIEWGSLDEKPVGVVILLAIRESDQATAHMKILAGLSRKLMHEEFRDGLTDRNDPRQLASYLRGEIGS